MLVCILSEGLGNGRMGTAGYGIKREDLEDYGCMDGFGLCIEQTGDKWCKERDGLAVSRYALDTRILETFCAGCVGFLLTHIIPLSMMKTQAGDPSRSKYR